MYEYGISSTFRWISRREVDNPSTTVEFFVDKFTYTRDTRWEWDGSISGGLSFDIKFMPLEEFMEFSNEHREVIEAKVGRMSKFKFSDFMQSVL